MRSCAGALCAACFSILNAAVSVLLASIAAGFDQRARGLFARTLAGQRETHTLVALHDTVLANLVSGELLTKDMERLLGVSAWRRLLPSPADVRFFI
jgi:selenophosphate synthetase-related protein